MERKNKYEIGETAWGSTVDYMCIFTHIYRTTLSGLGEKEEQKQSGKQSVFRAKVLLVPRLPHFQSC